MNLKVQSQIAYAFRKYLFYLFFLCLPSFFAAAANDTIYKILG